MLNYGIKRKKWYSSLYSYWGGNSSALTLKAVFLEVSGLFCYYSAGSFINVQGGMLIFGVFLHFKNMHLSQEKLYRFSNFCYFDLI